MGGVDESGVGSGRVGPFWIERPGMGGVDLWSGRGSGRVGPFWCPKAVSMPASRRKRRLTPES